MNEVEVKVNKKAIDMLNQLKKNALVVGYKANGKGGKVVNKYGTRVIDYAAFNNYGASHEVEVYDKKTKTRKKKTIRIPARPFMLSIFLKRQMIHKVLEHTIRNILLLEEDVHTALLRLGSLLIKYQVEVIKGWTEPPNTESTIKSKGFNDPLVNTGLMQRSLEVWMTKR